MVALLVYGVFSKAASKALRSKRISNFENTPWNKTNELQVQVIGVWPTWAYRIALY